MNLGCVLINYNDFQNVYDTYIQFKNMTSIKRIVIVDNNSNQNNKDKLKTIINSEKLDIIFSDYNGGYGYGNNIGIGFLLKKYNCDYVVISNNDVIVDQATVDGLLDSMSSNNASVSSALQLTRNYEKFENTYWQIPSFYNELFRLGFILRRFIKKPIRTIEENKIINCDCVSGSFLIVNVNDFESIGGYDERIFLYHEEIVLGIKLKKMNLKTICDTNYSYIHMHGITISKSVNKIEKFKIFLDSKKQLLLNYYKCNYIKKTLISLLFNIYLYEYKIKLFFSKNR